MEETLSCVGSSSAGDNQIREHHPEHPSCLPRFSGESYLGVWETLCFENKNPFLRGELGALGGSLPISTDFSSPSDSTSRGGSLSEAGRNARERLPNFQNRRGSQGELVDRVRFCRGPSDLVSISVERGESEFTSCQLPLRTTPQTRVIRCHIVVVLGSQNISQTENNFRNFWASAWIGVPAPLYHLPQIISYARVRRSLRSDPR